jgi:transposase-like protein
MTKVMTEQVDAFNKRPLSARYVCVYLDATYIPVRRETVSKEAIYLAVGIREDGSKEVLSYTIAPTESAFNWQELLLNKQIKKKYTKRKEQFPNEEALERFLVSQFEDYNQRFATRCHIGFDKARAELATMFETKE